MEDFEIARTANQAQNAIPPDKDEDDNNQGHGPEQGGASGHPVQEQDTVQDYVAQPIQLDGNIDNELVGFLKGTANNPINWPAMGVPVSDYNTPGLQMAAFPMNTFLFFYLV